MAHPSTGRIQQLAYNTSHKQADTKYLLMVTTENGENCSVLFEISNNGPIFYSIQNKIKENTVHTAVLNTVVRTQDGHKRSGDEGDRCDTWYTDQRLHVQMFVGQGDRVVKQLTENTAAEFSVPTSAGTLTFTCLVQATAQQRYHFGYILLPSQ